MQIRHKSKGSSVIGAALTAIALIAFAPVSSAQGAGAKPAPPPAAQQAPPATDSAPAPDNSSNSTGNAKDAAKNNGQQSPSQQPATQQPGAPIQSTTESEKERLAVNPVTGLVTASAKDFTPLTGKERWRVYWKGTYFSVGAYFKPFFSALLLDQTMNSPREWGGGFHGFGLRVASRTGNNIVQGNIRAPLAAVLHEDVRYVYSSQHGRWRRVLHGVEYSFLTYNDHGNPTLNISKLVGYYGSTAVSTLWHPGRQSVLKYTFTNGSEQLGLSIPFNVFQEFYPDLARKFAHHR